MNLSDLMGMLNSDQSSDAKKSMPPGMANMDPAQLQMMKEMIGPAAKDPEMMKQISGYWKMLDNMSATDPGGYDKYIKTQMDDMKEHTKEEKKDEEKQNTIQSQPGVSMSIRPVKFIEKSQQQPEIASKKKDNDIKLFDFGSAEIKESFVSNFDKAEPLEGTKFYLNLVSSDQVLPPLNKSRDFASATDDSTWQIIPIAFTAPFKTRQNISGVDCIHYDAHVNTCVIQKMRQGKKSFQAIMNYAVQRFQHMLKDQVLLHKGSIKFVQKKKYKHHMGGNSQEVAPFVLPKEHNKDYYKKVRDTFKKNEEKEKKQQFSKESVQMPSASSAKQDQKQEEFKELRIPGKQGTLSSEKPTELLSNDPVKKPLIMEVITKTQPKVEVTPQDNTIQAVIYVEKESSAKNIDLDISETELKLDSRYYQFNYSFPNGIKVDPDSVKAKFSKAKKTLTLTITKK